MCVQCVLATCDEQRVFARTGSGLVPPLGWGLISLSVRLFHFPQSLLSLTVSTVPPIPPTWPLASLYLCSLFVHLSHTQTSLLIWTQPKKSIGGLSLSAPISSYLLFSGTLIRWWSPGGSRHAAANTQMSGIDALSQHNGRARKPGHM